MISVYFCTLKVFKSIYFLHALLMHITAGTKNGFMGTILGQKHYEFIILSKGERFEF